MVHATTHLLEPKVLYIDKAGACCMFKSCLKVKHKEKWKWKQKQTNNKKIVASFNFYYLKRISFTYMDDAVYETFSFLCNDSDTSVAIASY